MTRLSTPDVAPITINSRTEIEAPTNSASDAHRNVTQGAAELVAVEADNMEASSEKTWLKLYDDASTAWTVGTTKPVFIMPMPAHVAAAVEVHTVGYMSAYCLDGYRFSEGISVAATTTDGDDNTGTPTKSSTINLLHRRLAFGVPTSAPSPLLIGLRTAAISGAKENLRLFIGQSDNTPHNDITGSLSTIVVYRIRINCTQNSAEDVYVRIFASEAPDLGVDDAELMVPGNRGRDITWDFPRGITIATGLSIATVRDKGATAGNSAPTGIVDLIIDINAA